MSSVAILRINSSSYEETLAIAGIVGAKLRGGETIELVSDLGGGKTAFVRGLARGAGSTTRVQSPTFTISRTYQTKPGFEIHHFDFHRLEDSGVVGQELAEVLDRPDSVVVVEWAKVVRDVLPKQRLRINIEITGEDSRQIKFTAVGKKHRRLIEDIDEKYSSGG